MNFDKGTKNNPSTQSLCKSSLVACPLRFVQPSISSKSPCLSPPHETTENTALIYYRSYYTTLYTRHRDSQAQSVEPFKMLNRLRNRSLYDLLHVDPPRDRAHVYETSWLLPPLPYAILRGTISLYIFTSIFFIWGWSGTHGDRAEIGESFSYFTWLTYWGLGFYMLFASIHTACYALKGHSVLFDRWPRALRALHGLFYTTVTTYPFLVTVVFWGILYSGPWYTVTFSGWQNVNTPSLPTTFPVPYPSKSS